MGNMGMDLLCTKRMKSLGEKLVGLLTIFRIIQYLLQAALFCAAILILIFNLICIVIYKFCECRGALLRAYLRRVVLQ